jgi:4-diphosphocytidyl-2-C-methyl-D-erythritol kinase
LPPACSAFAPAKINLHLHVTGRRDDGYHLLDSLVVFAGTGDRLTVSPSPTLSLRVVGPFAAGLATEPDNLVLRAARGLADLAGIRAHGALLLEKNVPVASGIGGGSADAAACLRLLCRFWDVAPELKDLARNLGADVPVCLLAHPARMAGIGDVLTPAPNLPPAGLVLVNPGIAVSTPSVFRARTGGFSSPALFPPRGWSDALSLAKDLRATINDLEAPARSLAPPIAAALDALTSRPGCLLARMSGSGATCFGLFASAEAARQAAAGIKQDGWWVWGGEMNPAETAPALPRP